jgi:hypothetical protein
VGYLNRFDGEVATVPGDYWFSVSVSSPGEGLEPVPVPVRLVVSVTGEAGEEPGYPDDVLAPGGGEGPAGYSPDEPFLIGENDFSAVASGSPVVTEGDEDAGWLDPRRGAGLGIAALSLVLCGLGAWRLTVRR